MARRKKRTRGNSGQPTPLITYTVTIGHEPGAECDSCAQPRRVLIEQENDAWVCEICLGTYSYNDFYRTALISGVYSWGDGI